MMSNNLVSKKELMNEIYHYFCKDSKSVLLVADMGFSVLDKYFENHKDRVFNLGIAEQATISVAAGMSMSGLRPIVYSQIPFLIMRGYEQIRYDINEHNLQVKLIGIGADNYFKNLGRSHCMDNDDLKMMDIFKNILILSPTKDDLEETVKQAFEYKGPVYIRSI